MDTLAAGFPGRRAAARVLPLRGGERKVGLSDCSTQCDKNVHCVKFKLDFPFLWKLTGHEYIHRRASPQYNKSNLISIPIEQFL